MTGPAARDESGIRFPPPLIYALFFLTGYGLHRLEPVTLFAGQRWPWLAGSFTCPTSMPGCEASRLGRASSTRVTVLGQPRQRRSSSRAIAHCRPSLPRSASRATPGLPNAIVSTR